MSKEQKEAVITLLILGGAILMVMGLIKTGLVLFS